MAVRDVDVLVVGAGAAGVGAAVAASGVGASVLVVERLGSLGGLATAAEVRTVCGLWLRDLEGPIRPAMGGFAAAFVADVAARGGTGPVRWRDGLVFLPYAPPDFAAACDEALGGVEVWRHTTLVALSVREGGFGATLLASDRLVEVRAATVVDTTGVAWAAAAAGAALLPDEPRQAPSLVITVSGLPSVDEGPLRLWLHKEGARGEGARGGGAPSGVSLVPGSFGAGVGSFKVTLPVRPLGGPGEAGEMEAAARARARAWVAWLRGCEGFGGVRLVSEAAQLGVRTGRRPRGEVVVTGEHVLSASADPEGVAVGAWPVERWLDDRSPQMRWPPPGAACEVPAGALISPGIPGLFFAGRALSADGEAIAALRVIGTCLATGYAAGRLAAGRVRGEPREHCVAAIRRHQVDPA